MTHPTDTPLPGPNLDTKPGPLETAAVEVAIMTRRSLRAFLPTPVPEPLIRRILTVAARAPSGTNTQPWKVYVLTGAPKRALSERIIAAYDDPAERAAHVEEYAYYPTEWKSPFLPLMIPSFACTTGFGVLGPPVTTRTNSGSLSMVTCTSAVPSPLTSPIAPIVTWLKYSLPGLSMVPVTFLL